MKANGLLPVLSDNERVLKDSLPRGSDGAGSDFDVKYTGKLVEHWRRSSTRSIMHCEDKNKGFQRLSTRLIMRTLRRSGKLANRVS